MDYFSSEYLFWAVALGGLSAVSLPLGSAFGLQTKPGPAVISLMAAFGAGALIAALSVELVAPTVFALEEHAGNVAGHGDPHSSFYMLITGAAIGGVLFVLLDQLVNAHGGFLRKTSSTIAYFTARKHSRQMKLLQQLSCFPLLKDLSSEHINSLVSMVHPVSFATGEVIAKSGDPATELIFVTKGTVSATLDSGLQADLETGNVLSIVTLLMDIPYPGTMVAKESVNGLSISKLDFDRLRALSPEFDNAARDLSRQRLEIIEGMIAERDSQSIQWLQEAGQALKTGAQVPDTLQLQSARKEHKGAPLAIWLGILLDGIPESFVIGAGLLVLLQVKIQTLGVVSFSDIVPYTLIAGLFLSNFPEALASSANMQMQGWSKAKIFFLWFVLMIITAVGAGIGFVLAGSLDHTWLIFAEGLAAGAMLTMIAASMIPEAVHMGSGNLAGLSTLAGFIAAISFKLLE
jgi:zinc transporter ZupT